MKKKKVLIIVDVALVLILLVCMIFGLILFFRTDAEKFKSEYEKYNDSSVKMEISKDNPIKYVEMNEVFDILENKTGVIYFGFPGCPWCRNMLPVLFEVARENNVDTIYYFNPKEIRTDTNNDYNKLKGILNEYLEINDEGEKVLYVPDVYFVKDGKIMGHHLSTVESQKDPSIELTIEQRNELKDVFNELFQLIK